MTWGWQTPIRRGTRRYMSSAPSDASKTSASETLKPRTGEEEDWKPGTGAGKKNEKIGEKFVENRAIL